MSENLGTAALYLTVNTEGMEAGVTKAKRSTEDLANAGQRAAQSMEQNSKRQVASLERQVKTLGFSREEMIRYRIETQTTGQKQQELLKALDQSTARIKAQGAAFNSAGLSAKQQAQALRGLPAQITDIATSLASGQKPLTVLLQQGGQLKDMFGGIVPAAKALGSSLLGLVNPYTLAAAGAATLFVAWKQGNDEAIEFNKSLTLTGNIAGLTASQMGTMAVALSSVNATQHEAAAVLAEVGATGKFTADQIGLVAEAALAMEQATGQAVGETVKQFSELADEPVKAALELNKTYHFLTESVYEQIKALEEQGKHQEAATLAIEEFARVSKERSKQIAADADFITRAYKLVSLTIRESFDELRNFGRLQSEVGKAQHNIAGAQRQLLALSQDLNEEAAKGPEASMARVNAAKKRIAELTSLIQQSRAVLANDPKAKAAAQGAATQMANELAIALDQEALTYRSAVEKLRDKKTQAEGQASAAVAAARKAGNESLIKSIKEDEAKIVAALDKQIKDAQEREKGRKPKGDGGVGNAQSRATLQAFKNEMAEQLNALDNAKKLVEERFKSGAVSVRDYFAELKRIAQESTDVQLGAIQQQIAALQARKVAGKDAINAEREIGQLQSEAAKIQADATAQQEILNLREIRTIDEKAQAIREYTRALNKANEALAADAQARIDSITMGRREFEIRSAINDVIREQADRMADLAEQLQAHEITSDVYEEELKALEHWSDERIKIIRGAFAAEDAARADWKNGAKAAMADFVADAQDVAGQTYDIFIGVFDGLTNVLTDFFTKGTADWKGFLDNIAAQITAFVIKQQLAKALTKFFPEAAGGEGGQAQALSQSAAQLAASAAPLMGAAAALTSAAAALSAAGVASAASSGASAGAAGATGTGSGGVNWAGLISTFMGFFGGGSANGNVFAGGNVHAFANGGVVGSPTFFPMSGKRFGLMGEAGPEAIVPLHRGQDGKLGIRMEAANHAPRQSVVNQTFVVQGAPDSRTREQMARASGREARRGMGRTGG